MKLRSTILLLLITGGLAAYIFLFEKKQPDTRALAESEKVLAKFEPEKITGLDITNGDTVIQLRKDGEKWKLTSPVTDRADASTASMIVNAAAAVEKTGLVTLDKDNGKRREQFKEYGVQKGKVRLKLIGDGAPAEMHFGKDTAFEGKIYARLETDEKVAVITQDLRNLLTKGVEDFRDRKLTPFESSNISSLQIKTKTGQIDLALTGEHWNISAPIRARASDGQALDLVSKGNNNRIEEFITQDEKNLAKFGLAEPAGSLIFGGREQDEKVEVQIGSPTEKDPEKVYVRIPGRASIYAVSKNIASVLQVKPNDLRDKNLARASKDVIDRVTVEAPGKPKILLGRNQEKWQFLDDAGKPAGPANETEVNRLIDVLTNTETTGFIADTASDLPKYGLDQPVLTVRLSSYSSENTAESVKGETPVATVQFGKTEGEQLYARLAEEPFIVAVPPGTVNNLPSTALAFKPLEILALDPKTISEITFQSPGAKPLQIKREGEKWTAISGTLPTNLDALLTRLASLRAAKWPSATPADTGLANAQSLQFKVGDTTRKLLLGNPTPDGTAFAKFEDSPDLFTVTTDTVQTLTPAVAAPAPAASPAAVPPGK